MLPRTKIIVFGILAIVALIIADVYRRSQNEALKTQDISLINDWKLFRSMDGQFSVSLPVLPQHASEAVPFGNGQSSIKYDMYLSQDRSGATFMISQIQYPGDFETPNVAELLANVATEVLKGNSNNKLKNQKQTLFQSYPSLDFVIENNDVIIIAKAIFDGRTMYVLTLIDKTNESAEALFNKFVESFQLKSRPVQVISPQGQ